MDTNYETVKSLIELLVKKSGFDLSQNYGEEELEKTRSYIFEFEKKLGTAENDEKTDVKKSLSNLKKREETWSNNAEVLGKSILEAYKKKVPFKEIEQKLNKLVSLASEDEESSSDSSLMSYIYDTIKNLEEKQETIEETLASSDYSDSNSKEIDEQTNNYLNNKIIEYENELRFVNDELSRIKGIETRDIATISSVKVYLSNTEKNLERLESVKTETVDKEIKTETWAKLEKAGLEIKRRYKNAKDTLEKFETLLEDMRESKEEYSRRKAFLEEKIGKCKELVSKINSFIESDQYADYTSRALDENKSEVIKTELKELKNKKDVIYINVSEVKKEIIKEWTLLDEQSDKKITILEEGKKEKKNKPEESDEKKHNFDW